MCLVRQHVSADRWTPKSDMEAKFASTLADNDTPYLKRFVRTLYL